MKKLNFLLAFLTFGLVFTFISCDKEAFQAPKDTWCYKEFSYNDTITFDAYCYYSTEKKSLKGGNSNIQLEKGLNIIITNESSTENSSSSILKTVTGKQYAYYVKSFKVGDTMEIEDDNEESKSLVFKELYWSLFYFGNKWNTNYTDELLPFVKNHSQFGETKDLIENISFSKILKKIAAEKLLDILE